ncbi:polysaccharide pyruvyl transferase family protein [Bacteroides stercoris]|jgi:hypothetical protein|uniref:polysaccharide pyruvyl transferase family protein n=1 Tax=Bacteroides stercoris TaxID=46506 RepID=UPI001C2D6DAF|nr:polysaccharide pyruvyl transferase family protein [Bacteroides stercoris]MBV1681526.1 polysaccharide pyruvyl transferase family protein [Bacteroides stercoris]
MKIGILTFQASHNCGSMLQAFALQYVISHKFHHECELINYANSASRNMYGLFDYRINRHMFKENWKRLTHLEAYRSSIKDYEEFSHKYLVLSKGDLSTNKELENIAHNYDMIIAGGDQVWNVCCPDAGKEYYLNFTHDVRKIAYSPSMGGQNILKKADNIQIYKQLISEFEHISIREPHGQQWLQELTEKEVKIVADPTLLLSPKEWCEILPVPEIKEKYIFNYAFYHNRKKTNQEIQQISQKTGLPVYTIDFKQHAIYKLDQYGIKRFEHTGPLPFLGLMKNASLILTQSFHGTLFSALFNRPFWSYNWIGVHNPDDDRAIAILRQFGLENRYQMIEDIVAMDNILVPIDYTSVNIRIEEMRTYAMQYLAQCLK